MAVNILNSLALRGKSVFGVTADMPRAGLGQVQGQQTSAHLSQARHTSPSFSPADYEASPRQPAAVITVAEAAAEPAGRPESLSGFPTCRRTARTAFTAVLSQRGLPFRPAEGWRVGLVEVGTSTGTGAR